MPYVFDDTICALATAAQPAARGVVRCSGPRAIECAGRCLEPRDAARMADVRRPEIVAARLYLPSLDRSAPCRLYVWRGRQSYTREPTVEIHTIGSLPLLEAVVDALCRQGARTARPGEFTLRAFLAGRLDLTQAEAVLGVIDAADRGSLDTALAQLAGGLFEPLSQLRERLLNLLAHLEASLDFAEDDVDPMARAELAGALADALALVASLAQRMTARGESTSLARVVLVGPPNAGKSSLFNALVGRDEAIVSHAAGTTRDYLAARVELDGLACELIDTAGAAAAAGPIDALSQHAAAAIGRQADVRLVCADSATAASVGQDSSCQNETSPWPNVLELAHDPAASTIRIHTKSDLDRASPADGGAVRVSSLTGEGLDEVRAMIREALVARSPYHDVVAGTAARCSGSLARAAAAVDRALRLTECAAGDELVAAEVRLAADSIGEVTGAIYTEELLDRIFSRFCIGK